MVFNHSQNVILNCLFTPSKQLNPSWILYASLHSLSTNQLHIEISDWFVLMVWKRVDFQIHKRLFFGSSNLVEPYFFKKSLSRESMKGDTKSYKIVLECEGEVIELGGRSMILVGETELKNWVNSWRCLKNKGRWFEVGPM